MPSERKIAIVYDWIDKWGGVERILLTLHRMFPEATFFTSYYDSDKAKWAKDLKIKTSFIQNLPKIIRERRIASLPFYPFAFESFNFNEFDLVISVTSSFAKSIITQPKTKHVCYLLTPTRFLWSHKKDYLDNELVSYLVHSYLEKTKKWDLAAACRPDKIISISQTVSDRCLKYYHRQSEVIYPPFDVDYWQKIKFQILNSKFQINSKYKILNTKYFLVVSRLEPYKKVGLVIEVFNELNKPLIIIGEGTEEKKLKRIAGNNITFQSKLSDAELGNLYSNAQALIMPQEEDLGFVSLEAQFFGCPVIAYKKGGARETIIEGKTGIFFDNQNQKSLREAIERFNKIKYNLRNNVREVGLENVERFSSSEFERKFIDCIKNDK